MSTQHALQLQPLGLSYALPSENAFRVDLSDEDYQKLVLQGLSVANAALVALGGAGPSTRAVVISSLTGTGTIAAGHRSIEIIFSADFTGTIDSVAFAGANDDFISFQAPGDDVLDAIAYVVTTGSIRVVTIG